MRPFVAFDQHIQLTAVAEEILRAFPPSNPEARFHEAGGPQFRADFGLRARTPCRLPSHQPRKGASRMLRSLMAKRCRYQARPRGTCLASARRSPANSRLKPNRGYSWMTLWRTTSGISLLRRGASRSPDQRPRAPDRGD